jgi:uncharacterized membrane protein
MTPEAQNTILEWIFYGLAVVGFYIVIVAPVIYIWHKTYSYAAAGQED